MIVKLGQCVHWEVKHLDAPHLATKNVVLVEKQTAPLTFQLLLLLERCEAKGNLNTFECGRVFDCFSFWHFHLLLEEIKIFWTDKQPGKLSYVLFGSALSQC